MFATLEDFLSTQQGNSNEFMEKVRELVIGVARDADALRRSIAWAYPDGIRSPASWPLILALNDADARGRSHPAIALANEPDTTLSLPANRRCDLRRRSLFSRIVERLLGVQMPSTQS
jgi:hypothetical protein